MREQKKNVLKDEGFPWIADKIIEHGCKILGTHQAQPDGVDRVVKCPSCYH